MRDSGSRPVSKLLTQLALAEISDDQPLAAARRQFTDWAEAWMQLAAYDGGQLPDLDRRISRILALWHEPILGTWTRDQDERLLDPDRRYLRNHATGAPVPGGEHEIEKEILDPPPESRRTLVLGDRLLDGVNALPLTKDVHGGRAGNIEADMLLLLSGQGRYRQALVEVKAQSNHPWYAAVELLRQLRLFVESPAAQQLFERRRPEVRLAPPLPVTAAVLAPAAFYRAPGRNRAGVRPTEVLLERMRATVGVDVRLTAWDPKARVIAELPKD